MRPAWGTVAARLRRREDGLTVVEVVVAGLILVVGGLGVLGIVDASTRNTFRAEQRQVVNNVLQREMEKIKGLPYAEIALTELPAQGTGANNPDSRVSDDTFDTNRDSELSEAKPLLTGGSVATGPESFQVEDIGGSVHRYVVWDECPATWLCADGEQVKRLIVVVKLDSTASGGGERRYQELQGQIADPDAEPAENPGPAPGGGETVPWTLWLTDTSCDQPERQALSGHHASNNTRGDCADGPVQGENLPGAPDLLWPAAPKGEVDSKFDYATDVEPQPDADQGLQLLPGGECDDPETTLLAVGVFSGPDVPDENVFRRIHRWLTPPLPATEPGEELTLTGSGTFELWTRTVAEVPYPGQVCAWLFVRTYGEGSVTDTLLLNSGPPLSYAFEHFEQSWPHDGWAEVNLPLDLQADGGGQVTLPAGSRLGFALSVGDKTETGLQFFYDEPSFDSRIQLETTGTLPAWP